MSDELKSALDLALEKLSRQSGAPVPKLTEDQKRKISEIRAKYQARIAEAEIGAQGKLKQAYLAGDRSAVDEVKSVLAAEKRKLEERMEREIETIRNS